jgi:hypothetical protein
MMKRPQEVGVKKRLLLLVLAVGLTGSFLLGLGLILSGCAGSIPPVSVMAVTPTP